MNARVQNGGTKARLRSEAVALVAAGGMSALSIRALCQRVGIRESSFCAHFSSKDELVSALLRAAGAEAPHSLAEELALLDLPSSDFVQRLGEELLLLWSDRESRNLRTVVEAELARSTRLREEFNAGILNMINRVAAVLERGVNAGELVPHAPPTVLAWSFIAPLAVLRSSLLAAGATEAHEEAGRTLARAHITGWLNAHTGRGAS